MELGIYGLGRMGGNMAMRLARGGHRVVAVESQPRAGGRGGGERRAVPAYTIEELVSKLQESPRIVWLMVPSGQVTDDTITDVMPLLKPGDIIIDGGNSNCKDSIRRARRAAAARASHYMDCGTQRRHLGPQERLLPDDRRRAGERSTHWSRSSRRWPPRTASATCGPHGAGHFVKMVHNGIEYGMMQAYAEGFEIMQEVAFNLDLRAGRQRLAARQRRALLAAGTGRAMPSPRTRTSTASRAMSRTPARAAGRCRRRSTWTCPRR